MVQKVAGGGADIENGARQRTLTDVPAGLDEEGLKQLTLQSRAVFFGTSTCPFCLELERTFIDLGIAFDNYHLDRMEDGAALRALLKAQTGQKTVPVVYIDGKFIGGCDEAKALEASGGLDGLSDDEGEKAGLLGGHKTCMDGDAPCSLGALFRHPDTVDNRVVRVSGVLTCITAILSAALFDYRGMHWATAALTFDYILRFYSGMTLSPIGQVAFLLVSICDAFGITAGPNWKPGVARQFASACGVMFSALATASFFITEDEDWNRYLGLAWAAGLACASGMQGFIDFCIACVMFGWAIKFKLLPPTIYMAHLNIRAEMQYAYDWQFVKPASLPEGMKVERVNCGAAMAKRGDGKDSKIALRYKVKGFDHGRFDFSLIRHARTEFWYSAMSLLGVAALFKSMSKHGGDSVFHVSVTYYQAIGLAAAAWTGALLLLWVLRAVAYPKKVWYEWQCPFQSNAFSAVCVCLLLCAHLLADESLGAARVLFWIGAPLNLLLSIFLLSGWMSRLRHDFMVSGAMMVPPLANLLAVVVMREVADDDFADYGEFSYLWSGMAVVMMLSLFTLTLGAQILSPNQHVTLRGFANVWYASFAIAALALVENETAFRLLFWAAVAVAGVVLRGYMCGYLWELNFSMAQWALGFPSVILAMASVAWAQLYRSNFSKGFTVFLVVCACFINLCLLLRTVSGIIRQKIFVGRDRFGPISMMVLTHEAIRVMFKKMNALSERFEKDDTNAEIVHRFHAMLDEFHAMHDMHAKQEDEWIEPAASAVFPGAVAWLHDAHESVEAVRAKLMGLINDIEATKANGKVGGARGAELRAAMVEYTKVYIDHIDEEELTLSPILRKYVSVPQQVEVVRNCFLGFPAADWFAVLPTILNNIPTLGMRVRYLRALLWALPERAQLIGMMTALGVDAVQWKRITENLYDIAPRGAGVKWSKY